MSQNITEKILKKYLVEGEMVTGKDVAIKIEHCPKMLLVLWYA